MQNAAFHHGLHCLVRQKRFSEEEYIDYEIIICDPPPPPYIQWIIPPIYTMDHPKFIVSFQKEESISAKMVEEGFLCQGGSISQL